jgi:hypothetical protein
LGLGRDSGSIGVLQTKANLLLANRVGHLSGFPKEIKVSSNRCIGSSAKRVIVELILIVGQLVSQAVVGILEVDAR